MPPSNTELLPLTGDRLVATTGSIDSRPKVLENDQKWKMLSDRSEMFDAEAIERLNKQANEFAQSCEYRKKSEAQQFYNHYRSFVKDGENTEYYSDLETKREAGVDTHLVSDGEFRAEIIFSLYGDPSESGQNCGVMLSIIISDGKTWIHTDSFQGVTAAGPVDGNGKLVHGETISSIREINDRDSQKSLPQISEPLNLATQRSDRKPTLE